MFVSSFLHKKENTSLYSIPSIETKNFIRKKKEKRKQRKRIIN